MPPLARAYRAALDADPHRAEVYRGLAAMLAARGDVMEAARLVERWRQESRGSREP